MRLPKLPTNISHRPVQTVQFMGLNLTPNYREGELADDIGLSSSSYPWITQIPERFVMEGYDDPTDIYVWDRDLFVVDGQELKKNGFVIGSITPGVKQMAVINTKLVIYPDQIYVDLTDDSIHPLVKKNKFYTGSTISDGLVLAEGIGEDFEVGEVVTLFLSNGDSVKNLVVQEAEGNQVKFAEEFLTVSISGPLTVMSSVPTLDFICSSNNRIWGVCNEDNTIYVSALGDPTDFFTYGSETGAYAVAVGSEGDFTGICGYGGAVCVWKEEILHKMLGSYPSEYYMIDVPIYGVQKGSEKSLVTINNMLYYKGVYGIYQYGGNQPVSVSYNLGTGIFTSGVACSDGRKYYINMADPEGKYSLYAYDLSHGLWLREEKGQMIAMANLDRDVYMLRGSLEDYDPGLGDPTPEGRKICVVGSKVSPDLVWFGEFKETVEDTFSRKGYTKLLFRIDMEKDSEMEIFVREDRKPFRKVFEQMSTKKTTLMVPVRLGRCDRFAIRIEGMGEVTIRAIGREYVKGSELN